MPPKQDKPATKRSTKSRTRSTAKARAPRRRQVLTHEAIALRAYELYELQGGGDEVLHWLEAERELAAS